MEDTELVDGFLFDQKTSGAGGPNKVEKAKIGLIQFCISPPKTDVSYTVLCLTPYSDISYTVLRLTTKIRCKL